MGQHEERSSRRLAVAAFVAVIGFCVAVWAAVAYVVWWAIG